MQTGSGKQQRKDLHVKQFMSRMTGKIFPAFIVVLFWTACAPKIYQPPHLGAEYRFDEGLKPEKPRQQLFDGRMHKYLQSTGMEQKESPSRQPVSVQKAAPGAKAVSDSTRKDSATTSAPATLPASSDSSHTVQH